MALEKDDRTKPLGLGEFLFRELRFLVTDIRQKLVEQGWFGRTVTPEPVLSVGGQARRREEELELGGGLGQRRPSFEEQWAVHEREAAGPAKAQGHELGR